MLFIQIGLATVICMCPLAFYLLYLASLNRRRLPSTVSGSWDFSMLLLGLSGFLLLSGPVFLSLIDSQIRSFMFGGWNELRGVGRAEARAWSLMSTGYFLILAGGIPALIRSRRHVTLAYNAETSAVFEVLTDRLDQCDYPWRRHGNGLEIITRKRHEPAEFAVRAGVFDSAWLHVDTFPGSHHVQWRWSGDYSVVRTELESGIAERLMRADPTRNSTANWLNTVALLLIMIMVSWAAAILINMFFPR